MAYGTPLLYTKRPHNIPESIKMRGVIDFTDASQFNFYEGGYGYLFVLGTPQYIDEICKTNTEVAKLLETFKYILENECKNVSGLEDITTEDLEFTDNISTLNTIGKVTKQSTAEISMTFSEKTGGVITNFIKYYLEGIRDPRTQAKTYHGLIADGKLAPGFENEIFTLMYIATDNTMLMVEKAFLLCNAYPTTSRQSIYEYEKGNIEKKDIDVPFRCFVIDGPEVDKRAIKILAQINKTAAVQHAYNVTGGSTAEKNTAPGSIAEGKGIEGGVTLTSYDYTEYDIFKENSELNLDGN